MKVAAALIVAACAAAAAAERLDVFVASRDHPAIAYSSGPVRNAAAELNRRLDEGTAALAFNAGNGYLKSLLEALRVPQESQVLVFTQTSAQASRINPRNPRAVFFRDDVAVGWVRGGEVLEIAAQDHRQGVVFYTLDQKASDKPRLTRNNQCLSCHLSWDTLGVPGLMVLSTYPMPDDNHSYAQGFVSDHRYPLDQRWGGWYVTGRPGTSTQPGARTSAGPLQQQFDAGGFLSEHSDVVALMVLEHQTRMVNLISRAGWEARLASHERHAGSARVADAVKQLVDYLLFVDEAPFGRPVQGSSKFADVFAAEGPRDARGRSLRQLDLSGRLLRYPCSYMIYTDAFDALPADVKQAVYRRMWQILSGEERGAPYDRLTPADRRAVVEILRDTKKDLPAYFRT